MHMAPSLFLSSLHVSNADGCGSGILALAALLLGAKSAVVSVPWVYVTKPPMRRTFGLYQHAITVERKGKRGATMLVLRGIVLVARLNLLLLFAPVQGVDTDSLAVRCGAGRGKADHELPFRRDDLVGGSLPISTCTIIKQHYCVYCTQICNVQREL